MLNRLGNPLPGQPKFYLNFAQLFLSNTGHFSGSSQRFHMKTIVQVPGKSNLAIQA